LLVDFSALFREPVGFLVNPGTLVAFGPEEGDAVGAVFEEAFGMFGEYPREVLCPVGGGRATMVMAVELSEIRIMWDISGWAWQYSWANFIPAVSANVSPSYMLVLRPTP
jgi:hypothetical protein